METLQVFRMQYPISWSKVFFSTPTLDFCPHGKQLLSGRRSVGPDFFLVRHLLDREIQLGPLMTGTMKQTLLPVLTGVLHARGILERQRFGFLFILFFHLLNSSVLNTILPKDYFSDFPNIILDFALFLQSTLQKYKPANIWEFHRRSPPWILLMSLLLPVPLSAS